MSICIHGSGLSCENCRTGRVTYATATEGVNVTYGSVNPAPAHDPYPHCHCLICERRRTDERLARLRAVALAAREDHTHHACRIEETGRCELCAALAALTSEDRGDR